MIGVKYAGELYFLLISPVPSSGFHVYHKITIWVPESCLLISIGLIVGAIMYSVNEEPPAVLTTNVFFLYMLPPIVLDSGYFMPTRPFFENIGTVCHKLATAHRFCTFLFSHNDDLTLSPLCLQVLWFAVVGTLWNSIGIGMSLFAICQIEAFGVQEINLQENLLFATIISAVDPVAVLSVFEDVSVNEQLYIVVFGECLFNDAVTVVSGLTPRPQNLCVSAVCCAWKQLAHQAEACCNMLAFFGFLWATACYENMLSNEHGAISN